MSIKRLNRFFGLKFERSFSLTTVLSVPFVLQTFTAVLLVGYFSYHNGQMAVNNLATQMRSEISKRIDQKLDSYLETPHQVNQTNLQAVKLGMLDLKDFQKTGQYFWNQLKIFDVSYINFGNTKGEFIGAGLEDGYKRISEKLSNKDYEIFSVDENGRRRSTVTIKPGAYPNEASWYTDAVKSQKPIWSEVYNWQDAPDIIAISASYPVYNSNKKLIGVLGVDLILSELSIFLRNIRISPKTQTFIIERNGMLVASSSKEPGYIIINNEAKRIKASQISTHLIRETAVLLNKQFPNLNNITTKTQLDFTFNNQKQFVQVTPWQDKYGIDWLIVIVVPECDFMAKINANNQNTILLCLLTLILAIIIEILTSCWIAAPIKELSFAAQRLTEEAVNSDFNSSNSFKDKDTNNINTHKITEFSVLSDLFTSMAQEIYNAFIALENANNQLEFRVKNRTKELQSALQKREQAEIALQKALVAANAASEAKTQFLSKVSHELRTPLNVILGFTQIMERDSCLTQEHRNNINIIHRSGNHLLQLINDVLSMSKIEAGKITVKTNSFDLLNFIKLLEEMLKIRAKSKNIKLIIQPQDNLPRYIKTDESKLRQILINLLGNAIKFTSKGSVTLKVNYSNYDFQPTLYFEIQDTGAGIEEAEISKLFVPFVQSQSGRESIEGTGLGLAISQKFVQAMGGDISIKSIYQQGSIFSFHIPVDLADDSQSIQKSAYRRIIGIDANQPKYRILIVEDMLENSILLTKMLTLVGFEVCTAANGSEGIEKYRNWQPHLICMDMLMPVMDGYEATRIIKQESTCIIIALTANAFEEQRAAIFAAGCDDLIYKPFTEEELLEKIAQHLGVQYIYENENNLPEVIEAPTHTIKLTSNNLNIMPREWLLELAEAAKTLDDKLVLNLIDQIPASETCLIQGLKDLVENFRLDIILDLIIVDE
ncbi:two-component hybrid sensor and regulator [Rivularia sp. IAM M-261]|nr:two-component hybrid sensor and regulator [Calothrix sp. PCC 7716]GJD16900.1 two-component hybrid sensor and regulator [Rivularia sp. IAM M-261]